MTPIDTATNTPGAAIAVGSGPVGVAVTPDGKTAYVTNLESGSVTPIDTATNTPGAAIAVGSFPEGVAVTPDQGPVASFSATTAPVGQAAGFDASASSDPDGTVASYHWDFGDGSSQTTKSPTTTHTYATAGARMVTLTVTDDAGCSTAQTFTGQTVSCNGSPAARVSHQMTITAAAPSISTEQQPASAKVGSPITDEAMISGGDDPTGTVTFRLYREPERDRYAVVHRHRAAQRRHRHQQALQDDRCRDRLLGRDLQRRQQQHARLRAPAPTSPCPSTRRSCPTIISRSRTSEPAATGSSLCASRCPGAGGSTCSRPPGRTTSPGRRSLLQPAPRRFAFARAHTTAHHASTLHVRVTPNARGRRLVHHHTYRVTLRLWVTYTPTGGKQRKQGFHGLHLPK